MTSVAIHDGKTNLPSTEVIDLEAAAGQGMELATSKDYQIPFLRILQSGSPEVKDFKPEYISTARPGMLHIKGEPIAYEGKEKGVFFIPAVYKPIFIEWKPKGNDDQGNNQGGGMVAIYEEDQAALLKTTKKGSRDVLPNGNNLAKHANFFGVVVDPEAGTVKPVVVSCTSTQLKYAYRLNTELINQQRTKKDGAKYHLPTRGNVIKVTTVPESNDSGDWYSFRFERVADLVADDHAKGEKTYFFDKQLSIDAFKSATKLYEDVRAGLATTAEMQEEASAAAENKDIPF